MAHKNKKTESFHKVKVDKKDKKMIRRLVTEEEFELSLEEIERMERSANMQIEMANELIEDMQAKLAEYAKLRELL